MEGHFGRKYFDGVKAQAEKLGYRTEFFWYAQPGLTSKRWSKILKTRNIQMLVTANFPSVSFQLDLDWDYFSVVKIGNAPAFPPVDFVSCNQHQTVRFAYRKARSLGYKRVALLYDENDDNRLDNMWVSGFLIEQWLDPPENRVPPFNFNHKVSRDPRNLDSFIKTHQVDAVISYVDGHFSLLQECGFSVPDDVAFISLVVSRHSNPLFAGMRQNPYGVGEAAANMVTKLFECNIRGFPVEPAVHYISSRWIDGATVRNLVEVHQ
jgi:LacI family transcriptional regulator